MAVLCPAKTSYGSGFLLPSPRACKEWVNDNGDTHNIPDDPNSRPPRTILQQGYLLMINHKHCWLL